MMPPGPNSPIVFGMEERVRRGLILGHMYVIFFKGYKIVGQCTNDYSNDHVVIQAYLKAGTDEPKLYNFVVRRCWVFTLEETAAFLN